MKFIWLFDIQQLGISDAKQIIGRRCWWLLAPASVRRSVKKLHFRIVTQPIKDNASVSANRRIASRSSTMFLRYFLVEQKYFTVS